MLDPRGRMPADLIDASKAQQAISYIIASPWDCTTKVRVAKGWAVLTGSVFAPETLARIEKSGLDA
jgi:hypothetical protein